MSKPKTQSNGNGAAYNMATQCLEGIAKSDCGCGQLLLMSCIFLAHNNTKLTIKALVSMLEEQMPNTEMDFSIFNGVSKHNNIEEVIS